MDSSLSETKNNILMVQANVGRYLVSKQEGKEVLILTPNGLRLVSKKVEKCIKVLVRIEDQKRLFWKEHVKKLQMHCEDLDLPIPNEDELEDLFRTLWHVEQRDDAILRIVISKDDIIIHYATQPIIPPQTYIDGMKCRIISWDREEYWDAQKLDRLTGLTLQAVNEGIEYLLMDEDGTLYKGTRSNIYFITNEGIKTANCDLTLHGATRKIIFEAVRSLGCHIKEDEVKRSDLYAGNIEAAFLISSLFGIIPVAQIDEHLLDSQNSLIERIKKEYLALLEEYKDEDL